MFPPRNADPVEFPLLLIFEARAGLRLFEALDPIRDVINFQSLIDAKQKLPNKTTYTEIEGANHSQFGDYGTYKSDEQALINADAQKQKTADSILQFLGNIN